MTARRLPLVLLCVAMSPLRAQAQTAPSASTAPTDDATGAAILTPPAPRSPAIHGPKVFGVRRDSPFLYTVPATGDRPMAFSIDQLPAGLQLDPGTGQISGSLPKAGEYPLVLHAANALGKAERPFRIIVGDQVGLTPAMGWNSWNCWATAVDQAKVLDAARAMVDSGLSQHGWTYINIDDNWQGVRGGTFNGIQPNAKKFSDIGAMVSEIHRLGLKAGIYSTPWVTSYAGKCGGSSENPEGIWHPPAKHAPYRKKILPYAIGSYPFATQDAKQWAAWGIDYLKYDWGPVELPESREMAAALRASGRDVIFSISNNTSGNIFGEVADLATVANSWRITTDIKDTWNSVCANGFDADKWAPFAGPGHFNDPDMLVVGRVGWGKMHSTHLSPDEQYSHISLWCLLSAPLLLGCDLQKLDPFTLGLLTNDEVLDLDQDAPGRQATMVARDGDTRIYAKRLEDGAWALGFFNLGPRPMKATLNWSAIGLSGPQIVRDLWRQKDAGSFDGSFSAEPASHGVVLITLRAGKKV